MESTEVLKAAGQEFEFASREFKEKDNELIFRYRLKYDDEKTFEFTEKLVLPKKQTSKAPRELIEKILDDLHLVIGVSYYKTFLAKKIVLHRPLTEKQAEFWNKIYREGLGEFYYRNKIDPNSFTGFIATDADVLSGAVCDFQPKRRLLVGVGGGKESIVASEFLKEYGDKPTSFVLETGNNSTIIEDVLRVMEQPKIVVRRIIDKQLLAPLPGAYNGHVPISSIIAFCGVLAAVLYDYDGFVVGNEYSSNFGNTEYRGLKINHQWSKTSEFEALLQDYLKTYITTNVKYFSVLRPFYELRIAKEFSRFRKYFPYFSSCNKNFRLENTMQRRWCGECPKCVFVFTLLAAFLPKKDLLKIFSKNLFTDEKLRPLFVDLLGLGKLKPFDCVGTFEEMRYAFLAAGEKYAGTFIVESLLPQIKGNREEILLKPQKTETVPANFSLLGMKNVLLVGFGKEGKETRKYLREKHPQLKIGIADSKQGQDYLEKQDHFDYAIKSPGIPGTLLKIPYTTATNIFFSEVLGKNTVIGVTGTKGKSTTASLIYEILKAAKKPATILGNIGIPMLSVLGKPVNKKEIFVIELSSYQLSDIKYSPDIAVATSLFPEHMNYHGSEKEYYEAKKNIVKFQNARSQFVYNPSVSMFGEWAKESKGKILPFDKQMPFELKETKLLGKHNWDNIRAAVTVARAFGIGEEEIKKGVFNFKPLPHRLQLVGNFCGITFYDDAISTTPESTIAALDTLENVETIFLGGEDRGYDFRELEKVLREKEIKNVVLFPETGGRILMDKKGLNVLETKNMKEAVIFAYQNTTSGKVCLLSTASPSYSLWKNFEVKGDEFQKHVRRYGRNYKKN